MNEKLKKRTETVSVKCHRCNSENVIKAGTQALGDGFYQAYRCKNCGHIFLEGKIADFPYENMKLVDKK